MHAWPGWYVVLWGATWGNNDAALQWFIVFGVLTFVFKKYIKKMMSKISDKIRKPLHEHFKLEIEEHKKFMTDALAEHHERIISEVRKVKETNE